MANYKKLLERRHKDEEDTAFAFQEFIQTFQNATPTAKTFIKSGIYNPGSSQNDDAVDEKGRLYTPTPLLKNQTNQDANQKAIECARILKVERATAKSTNIPKPKSNLELLKEELQQRHQQIERNANANTCALLPATPRKKDDTDSLDNTTNLFLTSLNPNLNEQDLMQIFGVYGPLASVKIMWPRVTERNPSSNIGFVGFMSRKDSERAFYSLGIRQDMRISWGKPIDIPSQPIYIPPEMVKMMLPPPYSGLPFNAQQHHHSSNTQTTSTGTKNKHDSKAKKDKKGKEIDLFYSTVKVTIPLDKRILCLIHRTIEFVIREGPLFEAMIMHKEINNPLYKFLFDNKSAAHIYYRWKLFSIMNGESPNKWSNKPFRMFETGSVWIPPTIPDYTKGMQIKVHAEVLVKRLNSVDQGRLIELIQSLTPNRSKIGEAMIFCVNRIDAARDIVNIITESFDTQGPRKGIKQISRLYLISDILYNSKFKKTSKIAAFLKTKLPGIFSSLDQTMKEFHANHESKNAISVKTKTLKVLRAWEMWRLFSNEFLEQLECIISKGDEKLDNQKDRKILLENDVIIVDDVDVNDDREARKFLEKSKNEKSDNDFYSNNFIKSKWETLDPSELEAQAMSTQRMHEMEMERQREKERDVTSYSQLDYNLLRKVEMKVIRYQDDLEVGKRRLKYCKTIDEEINVYRKRCIRKMQSKRKS